MDPLSHAAFGAASAQWGGGGRRLAAASGLGAAAALLPDVDVLLRSSGDPLLFLELHRQFTHSLAVAPAGALLCAALLHRFVSAPWRLWRSYLLCLLGYGSHLLLDACTAWGTGLYWPFSSRRVHWDNVAYIDPVLTVPAALLAAWAIWRRRRSYAAAAAIWVLGYLALGVLQHERAAAAAERIAASRGHRPERLAVLPALGSDVLWKTIYEHGGRYYVDAVRAGLTVHGYAGGSVPRLVAGRDFPWLEPGMRQARDLARFARVADGYVAVDPAHPDRVVDLRYSMVPNEISGFWALQLDPDAGRQAHADVVATRERAPQQAARLIRMIFAGGG
jgi:inner membrane protein